MIWKILLSASNSLASQAFNGRCFRYISTFLIRKSQEEFLFICEMLQQSNLQIRILRILLQLTVKDVLDYQFIKNQNSILLMLLKVLRKLLTDSEKALPGYEFIRVQDQGAYINNAIGEVKNYSPRRNSSCSFYSLCFPQEDRYYTGDQCGNSYFNNCNIQPDVFQPPHPQYYDSRRACSWCRNACRQCNCCS